MRSSSNCSGRPTCYTSYIIAMCHVAPVGKAEPRFQLATLWIFHLPSSFLPSFDSCEGTVLYSIAPFGRLFPCIKKHEYRTCRYKCCSNSSKRMDQFWKMAPFDCFICLYLSFPTSVAGNFHGVAKCRSNAEKNQNACQHRATKVTTSDPIRP